MNEGARVIVRADSRLEVVTFGDRIVRLPAKGTVLRRGPTIAGRETFDVLIDGETEERSFASSRLYEMPIVDMLGEIA